MIRVTAATLVTAITSIAFAQDERLRTSSQLRTCDTTFDGGPDGAWTVVLDWTNGIPGINDLACFLPEANALADSWPGIARIVEPNRAVGGYGFVTETVAREGPRRHLKSNNLRFLRPIGAVTYTNTTTGSVRLRRTPPVATFQRPIRGERLPADSVTDPGFIACIRWPD